eukprot:m.258849 g.258849  ORF g.258849 m.258849 type:complete len:83 (+) comp15971_c0_seq2:661-909(+)
MHQARRIFIATHLLTATSEVRFKGATFCPALCSIELELRSAELEQSRQYRSAPTGLVRAKHTLVHSSRFLAVSYLLRQFPVT